MMASKVEIRKEIRSRRKALGPSKRSELGRLIQKRLLDSKLFEQAACIGSYIATATEVPTAAIHAECFSQRKKVVVPYSSGQHEDYREGYRFVELAENTAMEKDSYGISQPADPETAATADTDIVIVPGVAFDRNGVRLGQGAGIYDRILPGLQAVRIGMAFSCQCLPVLPVEEHDIRMDFIINEKEFLQIERQ